MKYLDKIKIAIKDIINQIFIISYNDCTYDQIENRTDFWFNQMTMFNMKSGKNGELTILERT